MERRVLIAIIASLVIIVLYPYFLNYIFPPSEEAPEAQKAEVQVAGEDTSASLTEPRPSGVDIQAPGTSAAKAEDAKTQPKPRVAEKLTNIETPLFRAVLSNIGGSVKSWELKNYRTEKEKDSPIVNLADTLLKGKAFSTILSNGLREFVVFTPSTENISLTATETSELVYTGITSEGVKITKTFTFSADSYLVKTDLTVENSTDSFLSANVESVVTSSFGSKDKRGYHNGPVLRNLNEVERYDTDDKVVIGAGKLNWIGMEDKYFLAAMVPEAKKDLSWRVDVPSGEHSVAILQLPVKLSPGEKAYISYGAFVGPKEYSLMKSFEATLEESIQFGMFSFLAKPLLVVLNFFQRFIGNYGIAIIILTILIKIIFYPLTKHSLSSMNDMKKVQPQMAIIKEKYKDDKQRMNKEMMDLYKRHKINPLSGCLPMLLQIPVFIGLYEALYVAIELRHAPFFLWITDLSAKDPFYISPLLMGGTMFLQQKMSPTSMDPTQSKMMMFMPLIFTIMFLNFPSGLVIYWLVNNVLTIGQQYLIRRSH